MLNDDQLKSIAERLGSICHDMWREKRRRERGWHSPEECPNKKRTKDCGGGSSLVKFDEGKFCPDCHPCMRPFHELSDSEKELPRQYPKVFFRILSESGYVLYKKANPYSRVALLEWLETAKERAESRVKELKGRLQAPYWYPTVRQTQLLEEELDKQESLLKLVKKILGQHFGIGKEVKA